MRYLIYLILTVSTSLSAGTIHNWVDENGNVNYGDAPPNSAKSENVRVQSAPSNPGKALPRLGTSDNGAATNKDVATKQKQENEQQASIVCENARQDLQIITNSGRVRLKQADGSTRFLSADEIAERRAAAEADVDRYCN
jgi:homogentisate 1,2-dioxygenase